MYCSKCGSFLEEGSKFCGNCGMPIENKVNQNVPTANNNVSSTQPVNETPVNNNVAYTQNVNGTTEYNNVEYTQVANEPKKRNKQNVIFMVAIGSVIGCFIVSIIIVVGALFGTGSYYFNEDPLGGDVITSSVDDNDEEEVTQEKEETQNTKSKKTKTSVVTDNVYENQNIKNEEDAKKLIVKDSEDQKKGDYPAEILKVEKEIILNEGILATNLKEMDPEYARKLGEVFENIYKEYPSVKGYITNLTLNNEKEAGVIAYFCPNIYFASGKDEGTYPFVFKTGVYLSAEYFLNQNTLKRAVEGSSKSGHFPPNADLYSPVAHELGHYLSFRATMNHYDVESLLLVTPDNVDEFKIVISDYNEGDFSLAMIKEAYQNYINDTSDTISLDDWRGTISGYALAKDNYGDYIYDETIAESFHDVYLNGDAAKDASKYIVAVIKKYLEE